jgi:S1 RNA binding domain protein
MPTEQKNIEPGEIIDGKVQGITTFGAFIELPGGLVGLVHISEIADTYVKDVKDFVKEGESVKVKVLNISGKKIGLSIKQTLPPKVILPKVNRPESRPPEIVRPDTRSFGSKKNESPATLDDKIARFLKESDERMQPLKNKVETRKRSKNNQ